MLSWLRRFKKPETSVIGFGKLPGLAEYVRVGARGKVVSGLEDWLVRSMASAATRGQAAGWNEAFASGAPHVFVLPALAEAGEVVAGVIQPSRDAVGRRFPLLIAATVPATDPAAAAHLVPALLATFLRDAREMLPRASRAGSEAEFRDCIAGMALPASSVAQTLADYDEWTTKVSHSEVLGRLYAGDEARAAEKVLHTLIDATAPFRGQESPPTMLGVRLPLVAGEEFLPCFWLNVVRRCAGWKQTSPAWFAATALPGSMLVQLGEAAPASVLADLWDTQRTSDAVCDLTSGAQVDATRYVTPFPERVADVLGDSSSSLASLLAVL